jgi:hypothetical protein
MHSIVLLLGAFYGAATAQLEPFAGPAGAALAPRMPAITPLPLHKPRDLDSCGSIAADLTSLLTKDAPTPGPALLSIASESPDLFLPSDACKDPVLPTTDSALNSEWTSFASAFTSWQGNHICDFQKVLDECATIAVVSEMVFASDVICTTLVDKIKDAKCEGKTSSESSSKTQGTLSSRPTTTGTTTGTGSTTTTQAGGNNAAGERTIAMGAALVGVLGLVAGL